MASQSSEKLNLQYFQPYRLTSMMTIFLITPHIHEVVYLDQHNLLCQLQNLEHA